MNSERRLCSRRDFFFQVGKLGLAAAAGLPFVNFGNTLRVIGALSGEEVDCKNGVESQNPKYLADAIVVPSAGSLKIDEKTYTPNDIGKMRLEAAAIAYANHLAPKIILLNGEKRAKEDELTEKKYLQDFFRKLTGETAVIPDEAILIENHSVNTATNMEELAKIVTRHNLKKTLIVTNRFHELRSTLFACANEVPAFSLAAEDLIISQDPGRAEAIKKIYNTGEIRAAEMKERFEVALVIWDPKGMIPTLLVRILNYFRPL